MQGFVLLLSQRIRQAGNTEDPSVFKAALDEHFKVGKVAVSSIKSLDLTPK